MLTRGALLCLPVCAADVAQESPVYASGVGVFHKIGAVRSLNM